MTEQGEEVDRLWDRVCSWNLVRRSSSLSFGIILFGLFFSFNDLNAVVL